MRLDRRTSVTLVLATIAVLTAAQESAAGAWAKPRGGYYAKVSALAYSADEVFNDMGDRAAMGMDGEEFTSRQVFVYAEYGLLSKLTLIAQTSVGHLVAADDFAESKTDGLGDAQLGVKYQVLDRPVAAAAQVMAKIPTGYHSEYDPPLGTGSADFEIRAQLGRSLYPLPVYLGGEVGYRRRGGHFSDQVPYLAEVGGSPHPRVFLKGYVQGEYTRSGSQEPTGLVGSLQVSEGDFRQLGANAAARVWSDLWVDVLFERVVAGENVGAGTSWGLGLVVNR